MRTIKLKMFGKKSVSAVLLWIVILCLVFILINAISSMPELIRNKNLPILPNISPLISQLALLVPLVLIFYTFQKKVLFTKQSIKYLHLFAICNLLAAIVNGLIGISFLNIAYSEAFFLSAPALLSIAFALFIAAIFKQGFQVQQENELTI